MENLSFENFKKEVLERSKTAGACQSQYKRALNSNTFEELAEVIKDNLNFNRSNSIVTPELAGECEKPEIWNIGKENTGLFNSGDRNSGDRNSGDRNSGYRNSGDRNSGDRNSGDLNSGDLNSGYRNSGYRNSGDRNSGDLNSGYRNSGVFCTRKREDTIPLFNKDSKITWDEWYNHPAHNATRSLEVTKWIDWSLMTDEEKKDYPKAFVCEGYIKTFTYHEAWANLWNTLDDEQKGSFKTLPNFDAAVFYEITGLSI